MNITGRQIIFYGSAVLAAIVLYGLTWIPTLMPRPEKPPTQYLLPCSTFVENIRQDRNCNSLSVELRKVSLYYCSDEQHTPGKIIFATIIAFPEQITTSTQIILNSNQAKDLGQCMWDDIPVHVIISVP